jgi:hypothetical protein
MATAHQSSRVDSKSWWEGADHPEFTGHFDARQRRALIEDDLLAGRTVSLVLVAVVAAGVLAMAITVLTTLP